MKNKKILSFFLTIAMVASLTSCLGTNTDVIEPKAYPITIQNMQFENAPNKVASLSPAITTMSVELGYEDKIVGVSDDCQETFATEVDKIGTALELNMNQIEKTVPEVIFTNVPLTKAQHDKLDQVNVRVVLIPVAKDIDTIKNQYLDIIGIMSGSLDKTTIGTKLIDEIDRQISHIVSVLPERKTFLYVATLDPSIATEDTIQSAILSVIGDNLAKGHTNYSIPVEILVTLDPDMIFYDDSIDPALFLEDENFSAMQAVTGGSLYAVKGSDMTLATSNFVNSVQMVAAQLYSDINFAAPEIVIPVSSGESTGATEGTPPAESTPPVESSPPVEGTPPAESTPPVESTVPAVE